jgi:three-Cys-motif partner protein
LSSNDHFEEFKDHTLVKHYLLGAYVKRWATILLSRGFRRVFFVDAFAGAGRSKQGQPGSPVIAAEIAQAVNAAHCPGGVTKSRGMHVLAIESDRERFASLVEQLQPWTSMNPRYVYTRSGELEMYLDQIMEYANGDPILFFLDPFGLKGLAAETYPKALAAAHNELLVLFNDEGGVRLHGKATADPESALDPIRYVLEVPTLFPELDAERMDDAEQKSKRAAAGHKSNPQARAILIRAFGGEEIIALMQRTPIEDRQRVIRLTFQNHLINAGAPYVLPFSVDTADGRHKYFLVHASRHKRAFAAMKDAMDRTRREHDTHQLSGITSRMEPTDLNSVIDALRENFQGQVVRWSDKTSESVQDFALECTPIWKHELPALNAALVNLGWEEMVGVTGKAQAFRFPKIPRRGVV